MRVGTHNRWRVPSHIALIATLIFLFSVPFMSAVKKKYVAPKYDITKLVWPSPPDQVRIRYLGQYNGELDLLGKKQTKGGMLERIAGISVAPEERPKMIKPYGVASDSEGRVYVADSGQSLVFVFDLEKKKLEFRGDKAPANIQTPIGVAVDEKDRLFVSDSKLHRITCFGPDGEVEAVFGGDALQRPAGLAVDDPLRRLYVADVAGKRIAVFDIDTFKLVRYFAEAKRDDEDNIGHLTNPNSIAIDPDGLIYVTDAVIARVVVYDTEGRFVRTWGKHGDGPAMFGRPKGIAIDADGHVYVADAQLNRMQVYSPEGKPLIAFGSNGYGPGQFRLMAGIAIDRQNRIIAVDQEPARIEVFHYTPDDEAAAVKRAGQVSETTAIQSAAKNRAVTTGKPSHQAQAVANTRAPSGSTVEELKKELADLKANLAAQQAQKLDSAKTETEPANNPAQNVSSPTN